MTTMTTASAKSFYFANSNQFSQWAIVNDTVMGGRSVAELSATDNHHRFSGNVSLENNGGFASIRYLLAEQLPDSGWVSLKVKGDGKIYQLRFRMSGRFNSIAYSVSFQTIENQWQTFTFPAKDFRPVWRGRRVAGAPELDLTNVQILSIFLSDKQTGPFNIELDNLSFLDEAK